MGDLEIMTRREAYDKGLTQYYTGRPCCRDHLAPRYTASGNCTKCAAISGARYSQSFKNRRKVAGVVEYRCMIPAPLVEILDAVIAAHKQSPPPCPNGCPQGSICMVCDSKEWGRI